LEQRLGIFGSRFAFKNEIERALSGPRNSPTGPLLAEDVVDDVIVAYRQMADDDQKGVTWENVQQPA